MSIVMDELETFFLNQEVRGLVKEFCPLDIPAKAKRHAILAGLTAYEPAMKVISLDLDADGRFVYLTAAHPRLGWLEIRP